jgi:proline dehydrogenase
MINFDNTQAAFAHLSNFELRKKLALFKILNNPELNQLGATLTEKAFQFGLPISFFVRHTVFPHFCGGTNLKEALATAKKLHLSGVSSCMDYAVEGGTKAGEKLYPELKDIIDLSKKESSLHALPIKLTGLVSPDKLQNASVLPPAQIPDKLQQMIHNLQALTAMAVESGFQIWIDAEESWLQPAIDTVTEKLMQEFNKEFPVVFQTVQMYRTDRFSYLKDLIEKAEGNYFPGIKLVRGAYVEKERNRAKNLEYESPIHKTKEDTDNDYNQAIQLLFDKIESCAFVIATHNENSVSIAVETSRERNILPSHPHLSFSQLYGMGDHLTYPLAEQQFKAVKYLPYGPVKETLPYLIRRAQENSGISGQMGREYSLLLKEWKRRRAGR